MNSVMLQDKKISVLKSVAFLYTNNELSEREMKENNPIYNWIENNKIPRNKFKQGGENCTQKTMTLMKENEEDTNEWKHTQCSWIGS